MQLVEHEANDTVAGQGEGDGADDDGQKQQPDMLFVISLLEHIPEHVQHHATGSLNNPCK